jgi:hypothetical protein
MIKKNIIFLSTGLALLVGLANISWNYYPLLKLFICGVGTYGAYLSYQNKQTKWLWILGGIALMFNPFLRAYLVPEENEIWTWRLWQIINLITGAIFIIYFNDVSRWGAEVLKRLKFLKMAQRK